jgi:hypothetical protein
VAGSFKGVTPRREPQGVDRSYEVLHLRWSMVLDREDAMALISELQEAERRLRALRYELRKLLEDEA